MSFNNQPLTFDDMKIICKENGYNLTKDDIRKLGDKYTQFSDKDYMVPKDYEDDSIQKDIFTYILKNPDATYDKLLEYLNILYKFDNDGYILSKYEKSTIIDYILEESDTNYKNLEQMIEENRNESSLSQNGSRTLSSTSKTLSHRKHSSRSSVSNKSNKDIEPDFQSNITKLKQILNNPSYKVFKSTCVRKKANWTNTSTKYKFDKGSQFDPDRLLRDLPIVSPKLNKLLSVIEDLDRSDMRNHGHLFKHFIFSDIKGFQGAKIITSSLIAKGINLAYSYNRTQRKIELTPPNTLLKTRSNNFYLLSSVGVYDQPISVLKKKEILSNFNSRPDNVYGDIARFIVMDSGFKEGIDLFDIKYIHIFEPQSTGADQKQVIGRGTRTCGQKGLVFHPTMGWPLYVFNYDLEINERHQSSFNNSTSAFDLYLKTLNIDLRLFNFLSELESTVMLGSVDYDLNINIHNFTISNLDVGDSVYSNSNVRTIGSLKTSDFRISGGGLFPPTRLKFNELREFISQNFSQYKWNDVKMENLCGYAGPSLEKGKLLPKPSFSKKSVTSNEARPEDNLGNLSLNDPRLSNLSRDSFTKEDSPINENLSSDDDDSTVKLGPPIHILPGQELKNPKELKIYNTPIPNRLISPINSKILTRKGGIGELMFGGAPSIVNLSPSQAFIKAYFTPETPYKGVLLNWSVGTGKTCAAIATATSSFESAGYTILWVTRTTLKNDIWKNMFEQVCSDKIREIIENAQATGTTIPADQTERMRLLSESWSIRPMSYKQFSNLVSKRNSFYKSLVNKNGTRDPLHKTLLIIDEAHKLYGGNDLSSIERPDMNALHKALMNSYIVSGEESVRVLLMTATPITVDPMELIKLLNLCKPPDSQLPENFDEFAQQFSLTDDGKFSSEGKAQFLDEIAGHISYLNREKDARQFAQPIIEQVAVPLVGDEELEGFIDKFEIPIENADDYEAVTKLDSALEEHSKSLNEWKSVSNKSNFKSLISKCDGLQKDIKKECIKTVKDHIDEIVDTAKKESAPIKEQITKIKGELKEIKSVKKNKLREIRKNILNSVDEYGKFKNSVYYNLKNVCGKTIKNMKTLKDATEKLPEIVEINRIISDLDEQIKQVHIDFKNKTESVRNHIAVLKEELKIPGLSTKEKANIKARIDEEEKRTKQEMKTAKYQVTELKKKIKYTKKNIEKDKKKIIQKMKGTYKKDLTKMKKELNKTLKKSNVVDAKHETEKLKTLIDDKKTKIGEDINGFFVKHRQMEAIKYANEVSKKIHNDKLKKDKEEEKAKKDAEKKAQKEEIALKKKAEKEEEKIKKDAEKKEQKLKKEAEKKEVLKQKKDERLNRTKKIYNIPSPP